MVRSLDIDAADGTIDTRIFTPAGAKTPLPAVIMFTDIGGIRPCFDVKAQRVADAGYAVLLPNPYYRGGRGEVIPQGRAFHEPDIMQSLGRHARRLTPDSLARDFTALLGAIDREAEFAGGGIGAVGYCMSGAFALRLAALHPDRIVAAAGFHSARLAADNDPHSPCAIVGTIKARVYFGHADKDDYLPAEEIARMDKALAMAGVHFTTEYYAGALHSFTTVESPAYDAAADALHFKRLLTLLDETLGA